MVPFEHLGPYRIGEPIGRGGMGSVFHAIHEKTGEEVAVKVIASTVSDDMRFRQRFSSEIETLKKLKHPNIVTLIGYGEQHGQLFYSMELVKGESLQQRLRREKRLAWPFVLDMAIDICNALKHAHNFGVIHRDLKPANLLITADGSPKLVDFGIAKLFGNADQTAYGAILGTADFMAPEQAGEGAITPRTDLYALGNVLYACFAGRPPFGGRTMTRILEAMRTETPTPLDLVAPDVPAEIAQLVHDLLEKSPEDRPPTALATMNRMKAIRAGLMRQIEGPLATGFTIELSDSAKTDQPTRSEGPTSIQSPTVFAKDPTASSTNPEPTDFTVKEPRPANPTATPTQLSSNPAKSSSATRQPTSFQDASLGNSATIASAVEQVGAPVHQSEPATHFSTIDERERRRGLWETNEEPKANTIGHVLSIAGMIALLLASLGVFVWAMQKPSPNELYASILDARESEDKTRFRNELDQFQRLYPNDERIEELTPYLDELDSGRIVRRLKLTAVRDGGDNHLAPHQESFMAAMRDIDSDPGKSLMMLRQWLAVYSPTGAEGSFEQSPEIESMAKAARQEVERLAASPSPQGDRRADELIRRIRWAEKSLSTDEFQDLLTGIVTLYRDKAWATPAVDLAKQILAKAD
jgi:serine/threonine protein kinase